MFESLLKTSEADVARALKSKAKAAGTSLVQITKKPRKATPKKGVGCDHCPTASKNIQKFTKVHGHKIMVWGLAPGFEETQEGGKAFRSRAWSFVWKELQRLGVARNEVDVQYSVRCFPSSETNGRDAARKPNRDEVRCCSVYNNKALEKSKAKVYIIFGSDTAKKILGKEFRTGTQQLWSENLKAKCFVLYAPGYFLREENLRGDQFKSFRGGLRDAVEAAKGSTGSSEYDYIYKQDYKAITTLEEAEAAKAEILRDVAKHGRIAADLEDDVVDGRKLPLCTGFSSRPGMARVFIHEHPLARKVNGEWVSLKPSVVKAIAEVAASILEDSKIKKVFHHGSYDQPNIEHELSGILGREVRIKGYNYDTNYSAYLADPNQRTYGLDNTGLRMFPRFGEYKTITLPESAGTLDLQKAKLGRATKTQIHDYVSRHGLLTLSKVPLKKLVAYNGADCDLTKRIEQKTSKQCDKRLVGIYKNAAFVLDEMVPNGPLLDFKHCEKLKRIYPPRAAKLLKLLRKVAKDKNFNPGSPVQVKKLFWETLGYTYPLPVGKDGKQRTDKAVLEVLARTKKPARWLLEYRRISKIKSTYIDSYEAVAEKNGGRLRTKWWLTGTATGRLSSGGGKEKNKDLIKVVNLQNVHGDPQLQNLLVPDKRWRVLYNHISEAVREVLGQEAFAKLKKLFGELAEAETKDAKAKAGKPLFGYFDADKNVKVPGYLDKIKKELKESAQFSLLCKQIESKFGDIKIVLGSDQGQIEVRVMAQASGDKNLIRDCKSGDIHSKVGHEMTGWAIEMIKKDKKTRTLTKNIHFGILFGLGANGLMNFILVKDPDSTIDEAEAKRLYDNYFKAYPGVARFISYQRAFVEQHGYVESILGFKRPLNVQGEDSGEEYGDEGGGAYWGNQAINTPVQGDAHRLMLMAIASLRTKPYYKDVLGVPGMEVHDAIYFWTPLKDLKGAAPRLREFLEEEPLRVVKKLYPEIKWKVPLQVEHKAGLRLGDTVEIDGLDAHEILAAMWLETLNKETHLNHELRKAELHGS